MKKGKSKRDDEEMQVCFYGFMDQKGQIDVPLKNRKEAGWVNVAADVEVVMTVTKRWGPEKLEA